MWGNNDLRKFWPDAYMKGDMHCARTATAVFSQYLWSAWESLMEDLESSPSLGYLPRPLKDSLWYRIEVHERGYMDQVHSIPVL